MVSNEYKWVPEWTKASNYLTRKIALRHYMEALKNSNYFVLDDNYMGNICYVKHESMAIVELITNYKIIEPDKAELDDLIFQRQQELLSKHVPKEAFNDLDIKEIAVLHKLSDDKLDENDILATSQAPF